MQLTNTPLKNENGDMMLGIVLVVAIVVGLGGYLVGSSMSSSSTPQNNNNSANTTPAISQKLELPDDVIKLTDCSNSKGAQYAKSENIPLGPVYNVWNDEVIGVEFMLSREEWLANESWRGLDLLNAEYDHLSVGLLSQGHQGFEDPHYHIDVYTITEEEVAQIQCPES